MKFPLEKYRYYQFKNKNGGITVVAVSSYAGRKVKGYAKCNPEDEFDLEKGKKLAAARCNLKVAEKRQAHATRQYLEASKNVDSAIKYYNEKSKFYVDTVDAVDDAAEYLREVIKTCK